jgi:polysaccharide pyruvyl transferase WcaK-like protein
MPTMSLIEDQPLRVALFGGFGAGNIGNDASLMAAVFELSSRRPGVEILCICNAPDLVKQRYGMRATAIKPNMGRWQRPRTGGTLRSMGRRVLAAFHLCVTDSVRMYRVMRDIDVLMVPGMGVMESGSMRPMSFAGPLFMATAVARIAGARVAFVSIGVDTASSRSTQALNRWTLKLAHYRSFRDGHSKNCAEAFGVPCAHDGVYPDVVFGLGLQAEPAATSPPRSVGIGVINYRGAFFSDDPAVRDRTHAAYVDMMSSFVAWLVRTGLRVRLLPGDLKDEDTADEIRNHLADSNGVEVLRPDSFDTLLHHMRDVDLVVASRYHNIVGAALIAKPVISLNYRSKNGELMTNLGLGRLQQPLDLTDRDGLCARFAELRETADGVARQLAARTREFRCRSDEQWTVLERTVLHAK